MKRVRFVALLLVSVMFFSVIQPAFAKERTWGEVGEEAGTWGFWSLAGDAVVGGAVTGCLTAGAAGVVAGATSEKGRETVVEEVAEKAA